MLVSHDRDFLDNVVTSTIVMEGDGRIGEFVGGYSDWLRQAASATERQALAQARPATAGAGVTAAPVAASQPKAKRSFKELKELEQLPLRIEALETQLATMTARMAEPGYYQRQADLVTADNIAMAATQAELDAAYLRWEALEGS